MMKSIEIPEEWEQDITVNDLTPEEIELLGEDRYRLLLLGEEMRLNPDAFNKEDRIIFIKEMTFEHKAAKEHWTKEEKKEKRSEYEKWFEAERDKAGREISTLVKAMFEFGEWL